ncbi:MAG: hypothetical protein IT427_19405 [Pirellulales bacterium]|nr:hypothetical protein [Pirellulales bacterium]
MTGRFLPTCCALPFLLTSMVLAGDPAALDLRPSEAAGATSKSESPQLVLMRNGEYLIGRVSREKERYVIEQDGAEIRLAKRDVDFVCRSLDEAYMIQRDRIAKNRIEDRLRLTIWCLQHHLLGYAAAELATAMEASPRHPGIEILDRRLRQAMELADRAETQTAQKPAAVDLPKAVSDHRTNDVEQSIGAASPLQLERSVPRFDAPVASEAARTKPRMPISSSELNRLSRSLPAGAVEHFIESVQPILMNSCSNAGCHGPAAKSRYALIRPAANGRITPRGTSQRNLFNTMEWLDHQRPTESDFLTMAREPHGGKPAGALAENSLQYQQLVNWVRLATEAKTDAVSTAPATIDLNAPATRAQIASPFPASLPAPYLNSPTQSEPPMPIEKPVDEKPFYEQPPSDIRLPGTLSPKSSR